MFSETAHEDKHVAFGYMFYAGHFVSICVQTRPAAGLGHREARCPQTCPQILGLSRDAL